MALEGLDWLGGSPRRELILDDPNFDLAMAGLLLAPKSA